MDKSHDGTTSRKPAKRIWAKEKTQTAVRLTTHEIRMLKGLVKHLRISQNAVLATALRELHDREFARKAA